MGKKNKKDKGNAPPTAEAQGGFRVKAIRPSMPRTASELPFAAGEDIFIMQTNLPGGYWMGQLANGKSGFLNPALVQRVDGSLGRPSVPLPQGWLELTARDGRKYYANTADGSTQWNPPQVGPNMASTSMTGVPSMASMRGPMPNFPLNMSARTLPPGWIEQRANDGRTYYANTLTGKTQWQLPTQPATYDTSPATQSQPGYRPGPQPPQAAGMPAQPPPYDSVKPVGGPGGGMGPLPPGWLELGDNTGRKYYANTATGQTQWTFPTAPAASSMASGACGAAPQQPALRPSIPSSTSPAPPPFMAAAAPPAGSPEGAPSAHSSGSEGARTSGGGRVSSQGFSSFKPEWDTVPVGPREGSSQTEPLVDKDSTKVPLPDLKLEIIGADQMDFGLKGEQFPVEQEVAHSLRFQNVSKATVRVTFLTPHSNKFVLNFEPTTVTIKKGHEAEVQAKLIVHVTTRMNIFYAVVAEEKGMPKRHSFVAIGIDSELSVFLDPDELTFFQPKIGEGAFGVVYRGEWRGSEVAIKMLKTQDIDPLVKADFLREVKLMTRLREPHIVNFYGAVLIPGKLCTVTEFCSLGSLRALYRKGGMKYVFKVKACLDAAHGMNFLHNNSILHRDLKPDNLLVISQSAKSPVCCKLTDFGTSKAQAAASALNQTRGIGTPLYMAPEVLADDHYREKADVYSFAIMLWELYTEKQPYEEMKHPWDIARFVSDGKRLMTPEGMPQSYAQLMTTCWAHNPDDRPSFAEIARLIHPIFDEAVRMRESSKGLKP